MKTVDDLKKYIAGYCTECRFKKYCIEQKIQRQLDRRRNGDYIIQNDNEGRILMTSTTLEKIKEYGHGPYKQDALDALLDYYGKTSFMNISEEQALAFLQKLENGEVKV